MMFILPLLGEIQFDYYCSDGWLKHQLVITVMSSWLNLIFLDAWMQGSPHVTVASKKRQFGNLTLDLFKIGLFG